MDRARAIGSRAIFLLWGLVLLAGPLAADAAAGSLAERPGVAAALELLDLWIEEQRAYREVPGLSVAVVHGGELVWAQGYGWSDLAARRPATPDTVYRIGSVTKLFTATAVLQLRDRGRLRLDDPVADHLPWFDLESPFVDAPEITVRHLLTHTAGLPREAAFPYWTTHEFPRSDEIRAALPHQRTVFAPESRYKYSNLGMALLGEVVAAAAGEPWADYVRRRILEPLGMDDSSADPPPELVARLATGYLLRGPGGSRAVAEYYDTGGLAPAAAVVSSARDLARFAALHLGSGDGRVLRASTRAEMQRPHWVDADWQGGRGLGFAVRRRGGETFVHHGGWVAGHRSHFLLQPEKQIGVVVLTNADDASPASFSYPIYDALSGPLVEATAPPPVEKRADPAWERYVGTYADPWGWKYRVLVTGGGLAVYEHNHPPEEDPRDALTRLEPAGAHAFRMPDGELMVFELGDDGRVERVRRRYEYLDPVPVPEERP